LVTALISLSALGYFIGWRQASAYYEALRAPWAASMLQPISLLQLSASSAVFIGISAFAAFTNLATGSTSQKGLDRLCVVLIIVAVALLFGRMTNWLSPKNAYAAATIGVLAYEAAAGITGAQLLARLSLSGWRLNVGHFGLLYFVVWCGLLTAPDQFGRARAEYDLDANASPLPAVALPDSPNPTWRLVHIADGKALLVSLGKKPHDSIFRIVEATDLLQITTVRNLHKDNRLTTPVVAPESSPVSSSPTPSPSQPE
jgi:hypothetical protein